MRTLPDWFAVVFGWVVAIFVLVVAVTKPDGSYINRALLWLGPLLAVAWTFGFVGMQRFRTHFRAEHEALGSPQLFGSPFERRHWKFTAYLFGFRFLRLNDRVLSVCFSIFVTLTVIGVISVLSLFGKAVK